MAFQCLLSNKDNFPINSQREKKMTPCRAKNFVIYSDCNLDSYPHLDLSKTVSVFPNVGLRSKEN